ncbi:uncharacterized, partial [Tachysurus ichikawai]
SVQQQSWSEGEGAEAADGSSEVEEGESIGEEEEGKVKGEKVGSKRKKTASSKDNIVIISQSVMKQRRVNQRHKDRVPAAPECVSEMQQLFPCAS